MKQQIGVHAYIERPMTSAEWIDAKARPSLTASLDNGHSLHPDGTHWVFGTVSEYHTSKTDAALAAKSMRTIPGVTGVEIVGRNIYRYWSRPK